MTRPEKAALALGTEGWVRRGSEAGEGKDKAGITRIHTHTHVAEGGAEAVSELLPFQVAGWGTSLLDNDRLERGSPAQLSPRLGYA